jgi:hypothetical protein
MGSNPPQYTSNPFDPHQTEHGLRHIHELHTGLGIDGLWRAYVPRLASRQAMVVWTVGQAVVGWIPSIPPLF